MGKLSMSDFKRNNFMLLCIVAVGVLVFVFIPEFIGLSGSGTGSTPDFSLEFPDIHKGTASIHDSAATKSRLASNVVVDDQLAAELESQPPLDRVAHLIDKGYIDYLVAKRSQQDGVTETDGAARASLNPSAYGGQQGVQKDYPGSPDQQQEIPEELQFIATSQISWANIKSRPARRVFSRVESEASRLLRVLPEGKYQASRTALMNYISALSKVPATGERVLEAPEAINYLNNLDITVTKTFVKEDVPREVLYEWAQISLSPVLGRVRTDTIKQNAVPAFNPKPTLIHATFESQGNSRGEFVPARSVRVALRLRLTGSEIERTTLLKGGEHFRYLKLKNISEGRIWEVQTEPLPVPAIYTILVKDKYGNEFSRHYHFTEPPDRAGWRYSPANNVYYLEPSRRADPRLDAIFAYKNRKESANFALVGHSTENPAFSTF